MRRRRKSRLLFASRAGKAVHATRFVCSQNPVVSVIIPAMNEQRTICDVIANAFRVHESTEVIAVVNGSTDRTAALARRMGARVLEYASPLGHDVGRSIGAAEAKGSILLFMDADFVIRVEDLIPLVKAVREGVDVALNSYLGPTEKWHAHSVIVAKHALNIMLSRPDLRGASLTTVPHAMSRSALDRIGSEHLAVPPKAHAIAIHLGLNVQPVHLIQVGTINRRRRKNANGADWLGRLIVGDHLEALHWLMEHTNERVNRTDLSRARELVR